MLPSLNNRFTYTDDAQFGSGTAVFYGHEAKRIRHTASGRRAITTRIVYCYSLCNLPRKQKSSPTRPIRTHTSCCCICLHVNDNSGTRIIARPRQRPLYHHHHFYVTGNIVVVSPAESPRSSWSIFVGGSQSIEWWSREEVVGDYWPPP